MRQFNSGVQPNKVAAMATHTQYLKICINLTNVQARGHMKRGTTRSAAPHECIKAN
jgi:hypothetical protein